MNNITSERFREAIIFLKDSTAFASYRSIACAIGIHPQCLSDILKHKRDVTTKILQQSVDNLNMNPEFLFMGSGPLFTNEESEETPDPYAQYDFKEITYVPIAAQAGYVEQTHDQIFLDELPVFKLPNQRMLSGELRCFDVAGDSMYPTLNDGEKIICRKVDQEFWKNNLRTNYVYVIITDNSIVVKRIENKIDSEGNVILKSDNDLFEDMCLEIDSIKEVWTVLMTINYFKPTSFLKQEESALEMQQMRKIITDQNILINNLNTKFSEMLNI